MQAINANNDCLKLLESNVKVKTLYSVSGATNVTLKKLLVGHTHQQFLASKCQSRYMQSQIATSSPFVWLHHVKDQAPSDTMEGRIDVLH